MVLRRITYVINYYQTLHCQSIPFNEHMLGISEPDTRPHISKETRTTYLPHLIRSYEYSFVLSAYIPHAPPIERLVQLCQPESRSALLCFSKRDVKMAAMSKNYSPLFQQNMEPATCLNFYGNYVTTLLAYFFFLFPYPSGYHIVSLYCGR